MGSMERSKKRVHIWKKAVFHFLLCFVMGFFTGFAPTGKSCFTSLKSFGTFYNQCIDVAPRPNVSGSSNRSLSESPISSSTMDDADSVEEIDDQSNEMRDEWNPRRQIIVITPTNDKDPLRGVLLSRLANTLRLVPPPLLWIVVESHLESSDVSEILRRTGVMYRHLVYKQNFTDTRAEIDHQRNLALKHVELHRLSGIVHFAGLSNVYDLSFFDDIREIEAFGTWPLAKLSRKRKKMIIEGPVCDASQVVGWHLNNLNKEAYKSALHISSFGFNSSILWDPERWGRLPSAEATKQNSLQFVKQAVTEDESKIKGVPSEDCSKVNIWQLHLSSKIVQLHHASESTFDDGQR
ncbi:beta-1,4-xylosyltransferase IRX9-like [Amaranthus tricolor]|uniref:beta-1,4-xylosyltransferase IRX9-like n=1 Tax=Amaranthus tricolor TaxID=29722 RepID=UPI0025835757|nr:beta-1,4-xylosyltransferase IRX9-like [Amaranthus tricolor]